jgi:hypothetical protein
MSTVPDTLLTPHSLKLLERYTDFDEIPVGPMVYVRVRQYGQERADYYGQFVGRRPDALVFRASSKRGARSTGRDLRGTNEAFNPWGRDSTPLTVRRDDLVATERYPEAPIMVFKGRLDSAWARRRNAISLLAPGLVKRTTAPTTARRGGRRTRRTQRGSKKRRCTRRN